MKYIPIAILVFSTANGMATTRTDFRHPNFVIVSASYNNSRWLKFNLDSTCGQTYPHYKIIYIDDASADETGSLAEDYFKEHNKDYGVITINYDEISPVIDIKYVDFIANKIRSVLQKHQIVLVKNLQRHLALHNQICAYRACLDDDIIVVVDADDALADKDVLNFLAKKYSDGSIWFTYGQFQSLSDKKICWWNMQVPAKVIENHSFRQWPHLPTHLRSFYAYLAKSISLEDLTRDGKFFPMSSDSAVTLPIIEMAAKHFEFIPNVLLIYNDQNSISDHRVDHSLQLEVNRYVRSRPPYKVLAYLPWLSTHSDAGVPQI